MTLCLVIRGYDEDKNLKEKTAKGVFFAAACVCILAVAIICIFLFINGVPAMAEIGVWDFLFQGRPGAPPTISMESFP